MTCSIYCHILHLLSYQQVGILCYSYQIVFVFLNLKDFIFISLIFSSLYKLAEEGHGSCEMTSTISCGCDMNGVEHEEVSQVQDHPNPEVTLLDLCSSCGAMSTGLCLGTDLFSLYFVTVSSIL